MYPGCSILLNVIENQLLIFKYKLNKLLTQNLSFRLIITVSYLCN